MLLGLLRLIRLYFAKARAYPWRGYGVRSSNTSFGKQPLDLPRVSLVL